MIVEIHQGKEEKENSVRRTVKDLDIDDQPREKAEKYGCSVLSTADLWALVLRTGLPGKPITELCRDLMRINDQRLKMLERRSRKELMQIPGIGMTKAVQIEAVLELIRRYNIEEAGDECIIKSSKDIYELMRSRIGNLPHEEIWAILLNRRNKVIKLFRISSGSNSASIFDVRSLLKNAILEDSASIILSHNHPSGSLQPSIQDDQITRQCLQACKTMDLRMLDHIIITSESYYSYNDEGKLS